MTRIPLLVWVGMAAIGAVVFAVVLPPAGGPYGIESRGAVPPSLRLPGRPVFPKAGKWTTEPVFPNVTFHNPIFLQPEPATRRLFIAELEGRIWAIDGSNPATDKQLILDLSDHTQGGWDSGMLNMAFHPEYGRAASPNRGYIYVFYSWTEHPLVRPPSTMPTWRRLSRFTVDPGTGVANRNSEVVLIDQYDRHIFHAGGGIFFRPKDGFLYVSVGDEGGAMGSFGNTQRIDHNLFSGVLRIDVDQRGGGISHPIRKQPDSGRTAHYYIPNDNPFVGRPGALEEFFAIGLRSPHRMTYDPVDDLAWIGDVGQATAEEVDVMDFDRRPLNFQWNIMEGTHPGFAPHGSRETALGIWTDPIFDYGRDWGQSVIGGYVYRGQRHPSLQGRYIFGDFGSGNFWALNYVHVPGAPTRRQGVELLAEIDTTSYNYRGGVGGLISFGRDREGELYFMNHGLFTGISRLTEAKTFPQSGNIPLRLWETGVFADIKTLEPAAGLVPYGLNLPSWTDAIPARHWIFVPARKKIAFAEDDRWRFPAGTVLVQHFDRRITTPLSGPAPRLETRLLVIGADGSAYAMSYRWRSDNSDADLVTSEDSEIIGVSMDNNRERKLNWTYSVPRDCMECHNAGAGYVLGVKTRQLAREYGYPGGVADNQLRTWSHLGLFDRSLAAKTIAGFAPLEPPTAQTAGIERRVRSYLDVNCAPCHGSAPIRAAWDAKITTPLKDQRIVFGTLAADFRGAGYYVVSPKDLTGSRMYQRVSSRDSSEHMPPVGGTKMDGEFVNLLRHWIEEMPRNEVEPPQLVRASGRGQTQLEVVFTEPLQAGSAGNGAERAESYRLTDGARVLSAKLADDLRTVTLTTSPLRSGQSYTLSVSGVADRADPPNSIAAGASLTIAMDP